MVALGATLEDRMGGTCWGFRIEVRPRFGVPYLGRWWSVLGSFRGEGPTLDLAFTRLR